MKSQKSAFLVGDVLWWALLRTWYSFFVSGWMVFVVVVILPAEAFLYVRFLTRILSFFAFFAFLNGCVLSRRRVVLPSLLVFE